MLSVLMRGIFISPYSCLKSARIWRAPGPRARIGETHLGQVTASCTSEDGGPWAFGFQVNERQLSWDEAAARQLIKLVLTEKLSLSMDEVEVELSKLACLVPDLMGKLESMRVDIIVKLLCDLPGLTKKLMGYKDLLPGVNISLLVSRWPSLVLDFDVPSLKERLEQMRSELPGVRRVELLVNDEPMLLIADIPSVLDNIHRIMPDADPIHILVTQPQMVLDMNSCGMASALDVEGFSPRDVSK